MKLPRRKFLHLAAGAAALPAVTRIAGAQTYRRAADHIIVGYAPGGTNDISARLMGQWLSEQLGRQFVIENRPGAGSDLATETVVHAPPDGYTLLLVNTSNAIDPALYDKLNFNFIDDIAPVAGIMRAAQVMVVNPSIAAKSVAEFITYAKANPGKINMGSGASTPCPNAAPAFARNFRSAVRPTRCLGPNPRAAHRRRSLFPPPQQPMKKISVLLADDHTVVRQGLRSLLSAEPDIEVVGEAENGRQAVQLAQKLLPNIVVMDIAMPQLNGLEAARQIIAEGLPVKLLMLSSYGDDEYVHQLAALGTSGYLMKQTAATDLIKAIHEASRGNAYFSPSISRQLVDYFRSDRRNLPGGRYSLTSRELEVLQLVAEGNGNKHIAAHLHLSIKTVKKHRQKPMNKLNIHDIAGLTHYAIAHGVVETPSASKRPSSPSRPTCRRAANVGLAQGSEMLSPAVVSSSAPVSASNGKSLKGSVCLLRSAARAPTNPST